MNKCDNIAELAKALVKAQADFGPLVKGANNPFFKSRYADLSSVMDVARGPLFENGLCFVQTTDECEAGFIVVETTLMHTSGEWLTGRLKMPLAKADPQGYGSAMTYARRYALQAILGLAAEDDDAEGAMPRKQETRRETRTSPPPAKQETTPLLDTAVEAFAKIESLTHLANHFKKHFKEYEADPEFNKIVAAKDKRKSELAAIGAVEDPDPDWAEGAGKPKPTESDKEFLKEALKSISGATSKDDLEKWAAQNAEKLANSPFKTQIRAEYGQVLGRFTQKSAA